MMFAQTGCSSALSTKKTRHFPKVKRSAVSRLQEKSPDTLDSPKATLFTHSFEKKNASMLGRSVRTSGQKTKKKK